MASADVEQPVFVSHDGRRRRRARWLGRALAGLLAAWVVAVGIGASGFLRMPPIARVHVARANLDQPTVIQVRAPLAQLHDAIVIARRIRSRPSKLHSE